MSSEYLPNVPTRRLPQPTERNHILRALGAAISSVVSIALSLPLLLAFAVMLPACLSVKWLLLFIYCNRQGPRSGPGPESVHTNDSRWLGTSWQSSVIHAVLIYEAKEGANVDHFRRLLLKRVIPLYPRLTQRLISLPISAGVEYCWLTDSKFSIDQHVFSGPSFLTTEKDLQDYVSKLIGDGLPKDKPPWQVQVFQSFGANRDTVLILRVHQSVADGTALMRLLCHTLADSQVIEIPERPRFGSLAFCVNMFRACFFGPLTLILWLFLPEDCNFLTDRSAWSGSLTVTWSASITLSKVIRIKQVTRSTVNCVLLSALAGAIRRLFEGRGIRQPSDLKVVVPMDLRNNNSTLFAKTKLGNKTSSVIVPIPVAKEGCIPRLWATRRTLDSIKTSVDPLILYVTTTALMSIGSASFARYIVNFLTDKASMQFASLPGPVSEISLEGQTLKGIYPIMPLQANLGISITTITYADQVFVSVLAERTLGPAAELLLEYLEDQIEVLWKLLLNRRVPGEQETSTLFTRARISESPVKEITSRLNLVQREVERLSECKESDKDGKLYILRTEFSELVEELRRRQSFSEAEDSEATWKPQRTYSYSSSKNLNNGSPKSLLEDSNNTPSKTATISEGKICESHSVNTTHHKPTKSESPTRTFESMRSSKKCDNFKDCIINISEINRSNAKRRGSKSKTEIKNDSGPILSELGHNFNPKLMSEKNADNQGTAACHLQIIETHEEKREKDCAGNQTSGSKSEILGKPSEAGCTALLGNKGPNVLCCDKHNLSTTKLEDQLFQPPHQLFELRLDEKFEDPDDSEIPGGVLI